MMNRASISSRRCQTWLRSSLVMGLAAASVMMSQLPTRAITPNTAILAQAAARPTLRLGSTGDAVSEIQALLTLLGYYADPVNGQYQPQTEAAVKAFQADAGLADDGIVGPATWESLLPSPSTEFTPPEVAATPTDDADDAPEPAADAPIELPTLREGMSGPAVARVQETLKARGFYDGAIDGLFGPGTAGAVMDFQESVQLAADGVVGPATWQALLQ